MLSLNVHGKLAGALATAVAIATIALPAMGLAWAFLTFRGWQGVEWWEWLMLFVVFYGTFMSAIHLLYKYKSPGDLPANKPMFCLLPKFRAPLRLSADLVDAAEPLAELSTLLASCGFRLTTEASDRASFTRGSAVGDFSIKLVKINLDLELPLAAETQSVIEIGGLAPYFDNGGLCKFAHELSEKLATYRRDTPLPPPEATDNPYQSPQAGRDA